MTRAAKSVVAAKPAIKKAPAAPAKAVTRATTQAATRKPAPKAVAKKVAHAGTSNGSATRKAIMRGITVEELGSLYTVAELKQFLEQQNVFGGGDKSQLTDRILTLLTKGRTAVPAKQSRIVKHS